MTQRKLTQAIYWAGYRSDTVESDRLFNLHKMSRLAFNSIRYRGFVRSGVSGLLWPF